MQKRNLGLKHVMAGAWLMGSSLLVSQSIAQTDVDAPVTAKIEANTDIDVTPPTNTFYGTRGLSQTSSAEALGEGRLTFGLNGAWYQQQKSFLLAPNQDANIFTGIGSISLGINRQVDIFGSLTGFGSTDYKSNDGSGIGSLGGGIQGTLPLDPHIPIRLGGQVGIFQGFSNNQINYNYADGYNYFETRTGLDFMAKLIQTLTFGHEKEGFKLHFNEGMVTSAETGTEALLMLGAGAQINMFTSVFGLEIHSRTPFKNIDVSQDPLWFTPSVQFRTPYNMNVSLGGDIALSPTRNDVRKTRGLEPYRLFAGFVFTFDTEYGKRAAAKAKEQREAEERNKLQRDNNMLSKNLVKNAEEDSLERARLKAQSDSTAMAMSAKNKQDSAAMAGKARQDSLALAESQRRLAEEKSKRSEAEKQLLSTGLLLLDAVYFETGKTDISINSKPYLNIIAKMLTKYPKLQIEVSGHTDNVGGADYNNRLSEGRAAAVATYMGNVSPELKAMLSSKGYGMSQPKADNKTAEGKKLNRRTELQVLNKAVLSEYNR